jgi:plastocyanin domain-containing protein
LLVCFSTLGSHTDMINKIIIIAAFAFIFTLSGTTADAQRTLGTNKSSVRKAQTVRVSLTERGYRPETFRLKKGVPARVIFIRKTEDECGREIVIPAYNIRRELPLNKPVTVSFTPRKSGSFSFTCGMDMLRGKVIVQ